MLKFLICLFLSVATVPSFAITITGSTSKTVNSSTDSIYVGIVWHYADTKPHVADASIGTVADGRFSFEINNTPPPSTIMKGDSFQLSIAYIILFKDKNGNQKLDETGDELKGICEHFCISYLKGDINAFLDKIEKQGGKKVTTLRKLKEGIRLVKVVKPGEQQQKNFFDDLHPVEATDIIIKCGERDELTFPNWT